MTGPTVRCLQSAARHLARPKSISFIGLGRMGSEMAFNLFSKRFAVHTDSQFVVCDVVADVAQGFKRNFLSHFPGALVHIATSPEQYVRFTDLHWTPRFKKSNSGFPELSGLFNYPRP